MKWAGITHFNSFFISLNPLHNLKLGLFSLNPLWTHSAWQSCRLLWPQHVYLLWTTRSTRNNSTLHLAKFPEVLVSGKFLFPRVIITYQINCIKVHGCKVMVILCNTCTDVADTMVQVFITLIPLFIESTIKVCCHQLLSCFTWRCGLKLKISLSE